MNIYVRILVVKFITIAAVLFLLCHSLAQAKQLNFSKEASETAIQFNYQWQDQNQDVQSLSFSIDKTLLFDRYRNFRAYKPSHAKKFVDQGIKKALAEQNTSNLQVSFQGSGDSLQIELKGENQALLNTTFQKISMLEKDLMQEYLHDNFYQKFTTYDNNTAIKPDHARIAQESVVDFKPLKKLILDKVSIQNVRKVSDYVLGFVQSIPYATLESRTTSSGAGFNPPLRTLWENQGDCDSKVTLTAAIFRALMPRIKMMLVFIDNHALLAINILATANELTIEKDGLQYVLIEPTGPALMKVGEISAESEFAIRNGRYYAEPFFAKPESK